jgi:hypothetical protein
VRYKEGILSTAKDVAIETGAVVVDTAKAGFEGRDSCGRGCERRSKEGSESRQQETARKEKDRKKRTCKPNRRYRTPSHGAESRTQKTCSKTS